MTPEADYDDDWAWSAPIPDAALHATADLGGVLPCCGRTTNRLVPGEGITPDPARVTCNGVVL